MKKSIARIVAREKGERVYTPETPCARGHTLRRTSDGTCPECRLIAERARNAANRETYNARKKRERQEHLPELAAKMRTRRAQEPAEIKRVRLERAKVKQREWRAKNPQHAGARAAKRVYKQNNVGKVNADTAKRRTAKMQRTPAWLTPDDLWMIEQAYEIAALRTKVLGVQFHVDHVLPLQGQYVSGLHVPTNLQVIPWRDNVAKANKYLPA